MTPDLRPPKSKAIESIKDLKLEIERIQMPTHITKEFVLGSINSFEAHWTGEADRLDDGHAKTCKCCNCFVASIYRRILGKEKKV